MSTTTTTTTTTTTARVTARPATDRRRPRVPRRGSRVAARSRRTDDDDDDDDVSRRGVILTTLASALAPRAESASAADVDDDGFIAARDGLRYKDLRVGDGPEVFAGDAVVVVFSARALPLDGGDPKLRRMGETFDPFVVGGAGASVSKGFKLEVGASTGDIVEGWERAFEGDGRAPRMKIGGRRAVRIPPNLAYGDRGHHCRDGVRSACEVAPGQSVEITFEILRYT